MFDLKKAVAEWKRSLRKFESIEDGTIVELESHLLDEFARLKDSGLTDEDAFNKASDAIGQPQDIGEEYFKESRRSRLATPSWKKPRFFPALILNYLTVSLRVYRRNSGYSLINILGLAIGMACSLLIILWVQDESSYDRFHQNGRDIYRVITLGERGNTFSSPAPFAPTVAAEIPEVVETVRIHKIPRVTVQHGERVFYEETGIIADASLFSIFSFPLVQGDVDSTFAAPDNIILSSDMSRKYFGDENPLGKTLLLENQIPLKVTGVMKDIPRRSHLHFDYVVPFKFAEVHRFWGLNWGDFNFMTYLKAGPQRNEAELIRKLNQVALTHKCPQILNKMTTFSLQNLHDIYLNPIGPYDIPLGNKTRVYLFSLIALFIAMIAAFNFVNLSTARAEKRTKEIGMRKVIGAERRQIISQFFGESLLITFISLPIALLLANIAMPVFNELTGKDFSLRIISHDIVFAATGIAFFVGLLAGVFPALYLSAIQPVHAIRGSLPFSMFAKSHMAAWVKRGTLRRILVTSQFTISIILILATLVVGSQMRLIREKSWHLDRDLIMTIPIKKTIANKYELFRNELLKNPAITSVAAKDSLPTTMKNHTGEMSWEGKTAGQKMTLIGESRVDTNYFSTLGMEIVSGRDFSSDFPADKEAAYILNEQAVNLAGLKDPVGKTFALYGKPGPIVGIVKNTVFQSLRQELQPQVFHLFNNFNKESIHGTILIRLKHGRAELPLSPVITYIRRVWNDININTPFEYQFLDQQIEAQYGNEQRLGKLFGTFALLTVFISCMGLIGLVSFVAEQRTKEIGIRKVLGASVADILVLLNMGLVKQVALATLLAGPLAYFFLRKWLQGFIYRISVGPGLIMFAGTLVLLAALLTGGFQAVRAARMNPTKSLHCN